MTKKKVVQEEEAVIDPSAPANPTPVYVTVDVDGGYWWATRDAEGELTASDGVYPDLPAVRERAAAALDRPQSDLLFTVEEDQRVANPGA